MSDLHMYELEDIAWDELEQIDDRIVPHPGNQHGDEPAYQEHNYKKIRNVSSDAGHSFTTRYVNQEEEGSIQPQKKTRTKSLEKNSWSLSVEGVIPNSYDRGASKEAAIVSSDSVMVPGRRLNGSNKDIMDPECPTDDSKAGKGCAVNDNDSCAYPLGDISQTGNDLSFLDNDRDNNESADLLYYGWPDIENFEDVDKMLRGCDSTFGFGSSNQDDMGWLSSNIESEFVPFKSVLEEDVSKLNNRSSSTNDSNVGSSSISYKSSGEAYPLGDTIFMNESAVSHRKGEFIQDQQGAQYNSAIHFNNSTACQQTDGNGQRKKQSNRPNTSEGKRKVDRCKSRQAFAHPGQQKQKNNVAPNSFGYLQTPTPYMHLNYVQLHPSDHFSVGSHLSGIKSEMNSLTSASPRDSSYASTQARPMESSYCHPFRAPAMSVDEKLEKLRRRRGFHHPSVSKQFHQSQNEVQIHSGAERSNVTNPADIDSSNVTETSGMSSGFDESSHEASSFRQLQQVVDQLDMSTKLCIRDSLYRLARSAEQRHRYANMKGGGQRDGEGGNEFMADGSNNGFLDMETDTNPIDRSVAHLLFHRPSDPSTMPAHAGSSFTSHTLIHGSTTSPPVAVEQLVCEEQAASKVEKVAVTGDG